METATDLRGCGPFADSTPAEVRAALIEEDRPGFDAHWRKVLAEAAVSFDLSPVMEALNHWRLLAWNQQDREAYKRSLVRAAEILAGHELPPEPFAVTKARLGL